MWQIILFYSLYSIHVKINIGNHFIRLFYRQFLCHQIYQMLINRNSIKLSWVAWIVLCLAWIMSSKNIILSFWMISYYLSAKLVITVKMQVVLWTETVFLRPLHKNHLLIQQLINATVGLVKTCLRNIIAIIYVLSEINPIKIAINYLRIYGN